MCQVRLAVYFYLFFMKYVGLCLCHTSWFGCITWKSQKHCHRKKPSRGFRVGCVTTYSAEVFPSHKVRILFFFWFFFAFPPTVVDAMLQNAHVKWEMETSEAYRKSTEATTVKSTKLCPTGIHHCVVPTPVSGPCLKGPNISLSCSQNHSGPLKSAPLLLPAT